jgi:hypothetical protein
MARKKEDRKEFYRHGSLSFGLLEDGINWYVGSVRHDRDGNEVLSNVTYYGSPRPCAQALLTRLTSDVKATGELKEFIRAWDTRAAKLEAALRKLGAAEGKVA